MKYFRKLMEEAVDGTESTGMGSETTTETSAPSWYYTAPNEETGTQGVAGNGEVPEWFDVSKFKSVDQQAKSYKELEKRFGGFTGAPEDDYVLPEDLKDAPFDEGIVGVFKEVGKEHNMSQKMFDDVLAKVYEHQMVAQEKALETQMARLGENAQQRIGTVQNWLNTNAPTDIIQKITPMANSAEAVEVIEWFMEKSKGTKVANNNVAPQTQMTESEFAEKLMAKDKHGNLKTSTDPEYKKYIDELTRQRMR